MQFMRENSIAIYDDKKNIILFVKIECENFNKLTNEFNKRIVLEDEPENISMFWVPEHLFITLYSQTNRYIDEEGRIYPKIYSTISGMLKLLGNSDPLGLD